MKQFSIILMCIAAFAAEPAAQAQTARSAEALLEAAKKKELVSGDLEGAIRQYREILAKHSRNRGTAAAALVRMGQCYEKLGDAEARKAYERAVRDFSDQKEAVAEARTRLAAMGGATPKTRSVATRQVWTGPKVDSLGTVSPDGRLISYTDWATGNLAVHDLASGTDRSITNKTSWVDSPDWVEFSAISRDSKQVAFAWHSGKRFELKVANLSGDPNPRRIFDNEDVPWVAPFDWTPDGQWIAVQVERKDRIKQLALVSTTTGALRVLKSLDWRGSTKVSVSPDGKYLAYDIPVEPASEQRDIFLLATDGSREIPAVVHPGDDVVLGWSPDGSRLLFASDRSGAMGIWALPVDGSTRLSSPELLKPEIRGESIGVSRSGSLFFAVAAGTRDILTASIDFPSAQLAKSPALAISTQLGKNTWPTWSPDGKFLAYFTNRDPRGRSTVLNVRNIETGGTQSFGVSLNYPYFPRWMPDGSGIAVRAADDKGRMGIYRIDVANGAASLVPNGSGNLMPSGWSPDGKKLYATRSDPGTPAGMIVFERDLASGTDREILRLSDYAHAMVSPDGRQLAVFTRDRAAKTAIILLVPTAGGAAKEFLRFGPPTPAINVLEWTPDSASLVFRKHFTDDQEDPELWIVDVVGGTPRKIALTVRNLQKLWQLKIHPDGRRIAFIAGEAKNEIWALENFLPAPKGK